MSIYKGDKKVLALYKGAIPVKRVYKGEHILFNSNISYLFDAEYYQEGDNYVKLNGNTYSTSESRYTQQLIDFGIETLDNCSETFYATKLTKLYSFPDTSSVTDMSKMFGYCSYVTELDLSGWNTAKVTNTYMMFVNCTLLTTLNVSGWDMSKVRNSGYMLSGCSGLTTLILGRCSQDTYDWWYGRLQESDLQDKVTIEYEII